MHIHVMNLTGPSWIYMTLPPSCHLQAANLLQASKKLPSAQDAQNVFATCSKLNSQQVSTLLHNCSLSEGEVAVNAVFAGEIIVLAQTHRDEALQNDGLEVNLEEDPNLELPFLIPQQGYSSDSIAGIPPGLQEYFEPMISAGKSQKYVRIHHMRLLVYESHSLVCRLSIPG